MVTKVNLNDMYIFSVIAEAKGITAASKKLNITKQSLSKRIANYEDALKVTLIARNTRSFELTQAGVEYFADCQQVIQQAELALSKLQSFHSNSEGVLRIHLPESFHSTTIASLLAEFIKMSPGTKMGLESCPTKSCLFTNRIDVQFRLGKLSDCSLIARSLGKMDFVHVIAPSNLVNADFEKSFVAVEGIDYDEIFSKNSPAARRLEVNSFVLCKKLILSGLGHGILPISMCQSEIDGGELLPYSKDELKAQEINIVYLKDRFLPTHVRNFINFLVDKGGHHRLWEFNTKTIATI